jgi:alcohol dehydrogenase
MLGEMEHGGLAEYVRAPAANCIPIPEGVGYEAAASLPVAWGTAWRMLVRRANLRPNEDVLVLSAAGGVGVACVQIAAMTGARVFAAASSDEKLERLKELGADVTINYAKDEAWDRTVRALTNKRGVDVVVDTVGETTWERSIRALGKRGRLVSCGATSGPIGQLDIRYLFRREHNILGSNGWTTDDIREVLKGVAKGKLVPVVHAVYPLEETRAAEEALEGRQVFGKVLVQP